MRKWVYKYSENLSLISSIMLRNLKLRSKMVSLFKKNVYLTYFHTFQKDTGSFSFKN